MDLHLAPLPAGHFETWRDTARERMIARNRASGMRVGDDASEYVDGMLTQVFGDGYPTDHSDVLLVVDDEREIGSLWLWRSGSRVVILDVQVPEHLDDEQLRVVVEQVRARATAAGANIVGIEVYGKDTATRRLVECGDWQASSIQMILDPLPRRSTTGSGLSLRAMTPERFAQYVNGSIQSFAAELMEAGKMTPDEAEAESRDQFDRYLPQGLDTPRQYLCTAAVAGSEIGIVWFGAQSRGTNEHAFILDIEVGGEHRGKGYGRDIMLATERKVRELGMNSIGLHVFATNVRAIALYDSLGYERMQEYLVMDGHG